MACKNCGECTVVGICLLSLCYSGMNYTSFARSYSDSYFKVVFRASGVITSVKWVNAVYRYLCCFLVAAAKPWVNFAMKSLDGWKTG